MEKNLILLFIDKRGGKTRAKIVKELFERPYNTNQLSEKLGFQYRTINHHLDILLDEKIVEKENKKYGALYSLSKKMCNNKEEFEKIMKVQYI